MSGMFGAGAPPRGIQSVQLTEGRKLSEPDQVYGAARKNIDWDFDDFSLNASGGGGGGAAQHPLQLYKATVSGSPKVRVRYGTVWGAVPPEVQGGGTPTDITPSNGLKVYAHVVVDGDGLWTSSAVESAASVPADTATDSYFLIGEMAVAGSVITINQAVTHSLNGQSCGVGVYNWWGV